MKIILEDYNENPDEEISKLFEDAEHELEKVDSEAKGKKQQIILNLAEKLTGKISTDTICIEIVNQLHSQVSERFIRECLPEKYKQKFRVKNAKKQKKQRKEHKVISKLAGVTPLNQEVKEDEDEDEKKQVMLVNAGGSTDLQNDDSDELNSDSEHDVTSNSFKIPVYSQQPQSFQEEVKEDDGVLNYEELQSEKLNLNEDDNPSQVVGNLNKLPENRNNTDTNNDDMNFEYSTSFGEIRERIEPLFSKLKDTAQISIHGIINKKTGKVGYLKFGIMVEDNKVQDEI